MTIKITLKQTIWEYQRQHIDFLYTNRKNQKNLDDRIGINISIIINSACFLEGFLEHETKKLLSKRFDVLRKQKIDEFPLRRIKNVFIKNIETEFEYRVSRATGMEQFDSLFKILSYKDAPVGLRSFENWEGVTVLFQLRNVLAHGREVTASRVSSYLTNGLWQDEFSGGYRKAEEYLLKRKLIYKKIFENKSINHIFTNKVTDHFYSTAKQFIKYCEKNIKAELSDPKMGSLDLSKIKNIKIKKEI